MRTIALASLLALGSLAGCATHIRPVPLQNPPPTQKLSNYSRFRLQEVVVPASVASNEPRAVAKLKELIALRLQPIVDGWNKGRGGKGSITITPEVESLKFVSGGQRVLVGAMAGSSATIMKLKITEESSGRVIGYPEFLSSANAFGGAFSYGTTDNLMLDRIVERMSHYLTANYSSAVGGPTGSEK